MNNLKRDEILKVLNQAVCFYRECDLDGFMGLVADSDDVIFVGTGTEDVMVGYNQIRAGLMLDFEMFDSILITYEDLFFTEKGDTVIVCMKVEAEIVCGEDVEEIDARQTLVFGKYADEWKIVHSHFSFAQETGLMR